MSIRLALEAPVAVEFRTTCVPGIVDASEIRVLGELIRGASRWALQQYHPAPALDPTWREMVPYPAARIADLAEIARQYVDEVVVRGAA